MMELQYELGRRLSSPVKLVWLYAEKSKLEYSNCGTLIDTRAYSFLMAARFFCGDADHWKWRLLSAPNPLPALDFSVNVRCAAVNLRNDALWLRRMPVFGRGA